MKLRTVFRARLVRHVYRMSGLATLVVAFAFSAHPAVARNVVKSAQPVLTAGLLQPLELVRSSVTRAVAIVQSQPAGDTEGGNRRAEIHHLAGELFDFDDMSRRILAQHWKDAPSQERDEFVRFQRNALP